MSGIVDTAMMGRYGAADLAAVAGASAVFDVFANVVLASVIGYQILAARFAGRDDPAGLRTAMRSTASFSGGIAVLLTLLCLLAGGWLTGLVSSGDDQLRQIGSDYLVARGPTLLLLIPFAVLAATFNAYQRPRYALIAGIVLNLTNLLLDWLLIYGPGPLPALGAAGNGLATTVAWLVGVGCLLAAARPFGLVGMLRRPPSSEPVGFATSIPRLGWPAIVSTALDYLSTAIFFAIIGTIGAAALGGGRIAFEVMVLLFGVGAAFAAAGRILIGRSMGAGRVDEPRQLWRTSQVVLLVPGLLLAAALAVFATTVARLFTSFAPVVDAAADALPLIGLCVPLMALTLGNVSLLRALGQTRVDMYGNLVAAIAVQLPISWLLAEAAGLGIAGAFYGVVGYWLSRTVLTEILARRALRQEAERST